MKMRHAVSAATHWESRMTYRTVNMVVVEKYTLTVSCDALSTISRRVSRWRVPSAELSGVMTHLTFSKKTRKSTEKQSRRQRKKRRKLSCRPSWLISINKFRMRRPSRQSQSLNKMIDRFNAYAVRGALFTIPSTSVWYVLTCKSASFASKQRHILITSSCTGKHLIETGSLRSETTLANRALTTRESWRNFRVENWDQMIMKYCSSWNRKNQISLSIVS
jgi:hypothetical protein